MYTITNIIENYNHLVKNKKECIFLFSYEMNQTRIRWLPFAFQSIKTLDKVTFGWSILQSSAKPKPQQD